MAYRSEAGVHGEAMHTVVDEEELIEAAGREGQNEATILDGLSLALTLRLHSLTGSLQRTVAPSRKFAHWNRRSGPRSGDIGNSFVGSFG